MKLRKITFDNIVRHNPKGEKTKERDIKPKKMTADSLPCKQNKKNIQNNKKFPRNVAASGFATLTK